MFSYDDTLADPFHGPLIQRAVADTMSNARSEHRVRAIIAKAVHEARNRGAAELAFDLRGVEEVAAQLGITGRRVRALAESRGLGAKVGKNTWVFRAADVEAMRERVPGRPKRGEA
jgi:hypothetical protein